MSLASQGSVISSTTRKAAAKIVEVMKPKKKLLSWSCYSAAVST